MSKIANDFEFSLASFGDKIKYEVGQMTLSDKAFESLKAAGLDGNSFEQVLARGDQLLKDLKLTDLNPANLPQTWKSGFSPAVRQAGTAASSAGKAALAVDAAATME